MDVYVVRMQVAVISDIHGNWPALKAVLNEIEKLGADQIVCLGDIVDPLPSSRRVFNELNDRQIPMIRGNHEDYVITSFENPDHSFNTQARFKPIQLVAASFKHEEISAMKRLPLRRSIDEASAQGLLFCHASPESNTKGWNDGVGDDLSRELDSFAPQTIVCGHWHQPQSVQWKDKTLITAGSVGIPLAGKPEAEFLVLERTAAHWRDQHLTVPYDSEEAVAEYINSGSFHNGGPMAWLFMCEVATATRHVGPFFAWFKSKGLEPKTDSEWSSAVRAYLESAGQWPLAEDLLASRRIKTADHH